MIVTQLENVIKRIAKLEARIRKLEELLATLNDLYEKGELCK